jgi:hypothetical protein
VPDTARSATGGKRPDGIYQFVEVAGDFRHYVDDPHVEPGFARAPLQDNVDVLIIGGGFGGLMAGTRLREAGVEASASSTRVAISAAPGIGTVIPAPNATSRATSIWRCSKKRTTSLALQLHISFHMRTLCGSLVGAPPE